MWRTAAKQAPLGLHEPTSCKLWSYTEVPSRLGQSLSQVSAYTCYEMHLLFFINQGLSKRIAQKEHFWQRERQGGNMVAFA